MMVPARFDTAAPDANQLWQRVLARLQLHAEPAHFDTYLRGTRGVAYDPGASVIRVSVANPFHVPWLEGKLSSLIHSVVADLLGAPVRVEFCPAPTPTDTLSLRPVRPRPAPLLSELESTIVRTPTPERRVGSPLNARYTFDSFVVGAPNRMAHAGATQVAETVLTDTPGYNPLYIHSAV